MPKEEGEAEEAFTDTKSPDVINPLAAALGGLSIEEFVTKNINKEPEPEPKPNEKSKDQQQTARPEGDEQAVGGSEVQAVTKEGDARPAEDEDIAKLLAIDPASLKTKAGYPASETARQQFKSVQSALKAKDEKLKAAQKELEEAKKLAGPPLEEREEFKTIASERDALKKELDLVHFENSPEWKETFVTPIRTETERVAGILEAIKVEPEDKANIISLIREAEALLGDKSKEIEYSDLVDKISSDYMKPNTASKFARAMDNLFELSVKRAVAYADKEKARQAIVESIAKKSSSTEKSLKERLEAELIAFEKTDVGQLFKKTAEFDFDATSKANAQKALAAIKDFQVTGQVTNDLAEMLRHHALKPAFENERKWLVDNYVKLGKAVPELLKENDELKRRIAELRGEGRSVTPQPKPSANGGKKDWSARGILGPELDKILDRQ